MFGAGRICSSFLGLLLITSLSLARANDGTLDYEEYEEGYQYSHNSNTERPADRPVYNPVPQARPYPYPPSDVLTVPRYGLVQGKMGFKTQNNRSINAFLGIKYASVEQGIGRFQPAKEYVHYSRGPLDATREPDNCPQFPDLDEIRRKEHQGVNIDDCLTLNIYTPTNPGYYPVMVFVHGEMLFDGSANEGQPDYIMEHEVVLVSINYRLGPFGFLTTLTENMPGNVALHDIKLALQWIREYIRYFNGDPDKVTLFGQAGGATLIHALSLSGKAEGLFHRLILQSGTALNPYFLDEHPMETATNFARAGGCSIYVYDVESINNCLASLSTSEILQIFKTHWDQNESRGVSYTGGFKLVVGDLLGFLPGHPAALVNRNTVPMVAGVTKDAGAFIMSRFYNQLQQIRSRNITDYINVVLRHTTHPRHYPQWTQTALNHIFTEQDKRSPYLPKIAQGLLELTNLILYRAPVLDSILYTSKTYPTYLYYFDYRGEFHRFGHLKNPLPFEVDATLSDDNIYLFPYPEEVSRLNYQDTKVSKSLAIMWSNFATHGAPIPGPGIWPNVTTPVGPFIRFQNSMSSLFDLDVHFAEGIPIPNLYPEYFTTTTTSTTMKPTTTRHPYYENYPNYHQPSYDENQHRPNYRPRPPYN